MYFPFCHLRTSVWPSVRLRRRGLPLPLPRHQRQPVRPQPLIVRPHSHHVLGKEIRGDAGAEGEKEEKYICRQHGACFMIEIVITTDNAGHFRMGNSSDTSVTVKCEPFMVNIVNDGEGRF